MPSLQAYLRQECGDLPMQELTVLAPGNDPFRTDTKTYHAAGAWLAEQISELGLTGREIHLRGLHYALTMREETPIRPDGVPYINDAKCWDWLINSGAKGARWLGYVPFDQIKDEKNAEPMVRKFEPEEPDYWLSVGLHVSLPYADELAPEIHVDGWQAVQPFKLVMFGEKSSLEPVLGQIAARYKADLYIASGEISSTLVYRMAKIGAQDGRPMVVVTFSDCDPAGWQMPISIARKLQAFKALKFPELDFQVRRGAVTPEQGQVLGLPSSPLKATELRSDRWRERWGVEQTEIDALTAPQRSHELERIAREALDPFYDHTLTDRVSEAQWEWRHAAQAAVDEQMGAEQLERIRDEAAERLETIRDQVAAMNSSLRLSIEDFDLPSLEVPQARLDSLPLNGALVDSRWPFAEQCRRLIAAKEYRDEVIADQYP